MNRLCTTYLCTAFQKYVQFKSVLKWGLSVLHMGANIQIAVTYNLWKLTRKWVGGSFRQIERKVACDNSLEFRKTKSKQNQSRTARSEAELLPTEYRAQLFATVLKEKKDHTEHRQLAAERSAPFQRNL